MRGAYNTRADCLIDCSEAVDPGSPESLGCQVISLGAGPLKDSRFLIPSRWVAPKQAAK